MYMRFEIYICTHNTIKAREPIDAIVNSFGFIIRRELKLTDTIRIIYYYLLHTM